MEMTVSATDILDNLELFWKGIEQARQNYKESEVIGFSNSIELNQNVKVEFWNVVPSEGFLTISATIPGLGASGHLSFSSFEVEEIEIPMESYGNHLMIFVNSLIKPLAHKAYDQWCEDTDFLAYLDQQNLERMTELLPKGFGMILEPEVRGYDIQIVDNDGELLYRAAGENRLDFEEDKSWEKLKLEIKLAWVIIYANGLAFKDQKVVI